MTEPSHEHEIEERLADIERREAAQAQADELKGSYGGISLAVRGSIVIVVVLQLFNAAIDLYVLKELNAHLFLQDTMNQDMRQEFAANRATMKVEHDQQVHETERNRLFIREIEKICLLTPEQRTKLQQSLTPAMKDLLMEGLRQ